MAEIQSNLIALYASEDAGVTYKEVVCAENTRYSSSIEVNKRKTKCGTVVGVSEPESQISGTFVAETAPTVNQVSHLKLSEWFHNKTKIFWKFAHTTTPANMFIAADGYITQLDIDTPEGEVMALDVTIDLTGSIDISA